MSFLGLLAKLVEEFRFGKQKGSQNNGSELQNINGLGEKYEEKLKAIGIATLSELCKADPDESAARLDRITFEFR